MTRAHSVACSGRATAVSRGFRRTPAGSSAAPSRSPSIPSSRITCCSPPTAGSCARVTPGSTGRWRRRRYSSVLCLRSPSTTTAGALWLRRARRFFGTTAATRGTPSRRPGRRARAAPAGTPPARPRVGAGAGGLYLVGWQRFYAGDDGARSWTAIASPLAGAPVSHIVVARGSGTVYAVAGNRLWAMDDRTTAWRAADAGLPQGGIDAISVDSRQSRRLWATAAGQVFRSEDGATTWRPWGRPIEDPRVSVRGLAVSVRDRDAVLTTDRGLYRSADGTSWE